MKCRALPDRLEGVARVVRELKETTGDWARLRCCCVDTYLEFFSLYARP